MDYHKLIGFTDMNTWKWMYLLRKEPIKKAQPVGHNLKNGYYIYLVLRDIKRKNKDEILFDNVEKALEGIENAS